MKLGKFLTDVGLVPLVRRPDLWWLDGPLVYQRADGIKITAPKGFITDDASIPKFLDWIPALDRQGLSRRPGLIHDALYAMGRTKGKDFCDQTLREMCEVEGISPFWSGAIYQGVHWGGGSSWSSDATEAKHIDRQGSFITLADYRNWVVAGASVFS
jgi:hypothetical protein